MLGTGRNNKFNDTQQMVNAKTPEGERVPSDGVLNLQPLLLGYYNKLQ
jgi:hypothetical protein